MHGQQRAQRATLRRRALGDDLDKRGCRQHYNRSANDTIQPAYNRRGQTEYDQHPARDAEEFVIRDRRRLVLLRRT